VQAFGKAGPAKLAVVLPFLIFAETVALAPAARPDVQARATVRVERGVKIGPEHWQDVPPGRRREVVRKTADGWTERIRIIDFP
jgi:hypothetical protein